MNNEMSLKKLDEQQIFIILFKCIKGGSRTNSKITSPLVIWSIVIQLGKQSNSK